VLAFTRVETYAEKKGGVVGEEKENEARTCVLVSQLELIYLATAS